MMALRPRAVVVHRRTELEELLDRHSTRGQAEFFLKQRGRSLAQVQDRHDAAVAARRTVLSAVPSEWAVAEVERADLTRFLFAPEDLVVVVGQDGLVANLAKYVTTQPVIGVNPEPGINPGVLARHSPEQAVDLIHQTGLQASVKLACSGLTMVEASLDDGQRLRALNEIFIGHPSHQSARYRLRTSKKDEQQSSSGVIVGTGTGATGWCASIAHDRGGARMPQPVEDALAWFVREAWPSPATGVSLTAGWLGPADRLSLTVASDRLVVFGDGIEADTLTVGWGQEISIQVAADRLRLVV